MIPSRSGPFDCSISSRACAPPPRNAYNLSGCREGGGSRAHRSQHPRDDEEDQFRGDDAPRALSIPRAKLSTILFSRFFLLLILRPPAFSRCWHPPLSLLCCGRACFFRPPRPQLPFPWSTLESTCSQPGRRPIAAVARVRCGSVSFWCAISSSLASPREADADQAAYMVPAPATEIIESLVRGERDTGFVFPSLVVHHFRIKVYNLT